MALSKSSCFLMRASTLSKESPLSSLARKASRAAIQFSACSQSRLNSYRKRPKNANCWKHVLFLRSYVVNLVFADLQLQTLVKHHPALNPGLLQVGSLPVESLQLLLDLRAGVVATCKQLLSKLLEGLESACTSINLSAVLLCDG